MKDYYKILEIGKKATKSEIVKSFRLLAKKYHPDLNKSADASLKFREVYEAYEILVDEHKRINYDNIYNNYYGYSNKQTGASNESDYINWTQKAQENAKYYSNIKYRDFLKKALKGSAAIILVSSITIIEWASVLFIVVYMPMRSNDISQLVLFVNIIIGISFGLYYYTDILKSEDFGLINIFQNRKKTIKKYKIYFIALLYAITICVIAQVNKEQKIIAIQERYSDLDSHINEYLTCNPDVCMISDKFNRGIVIIDMDKKSIDYELTNSLSDSIKAFKNENLNTLIQVWRFDTKVGTYTDDAEGIQHSCKYKIIDYKTKVVLAEHQINGTMPPSTKSYHGSGSGSNPNPDLVKLIVENVK